MFTMATPSTIDKQLSQKNAPGVFKKSFRYHTIPEEKPLFKGGVMVSIPPLLYVRELIEFVKSCNKRNCSDVQNTTVANGPSNIL